MVEDFGLEFAYQRYRDLARFRYQCCAICYANGLWHTPKFLSVVSAFSQDI